MAYGYGGLANTTGSDAGDVLLCGLANLSGRFRGFVIGRIPGAREVVAGGNLKKSA